jgi:uncharacterized protein (DUF2147 family)
VGRDAQRVWHKSTPRSAISSAAAGLAINADLDYHPAHETAIMEIRQTVADIVDRSIAGRLRGRAGLLRGGDHRASKSGDRMIARGADRLRLLTWLSLALIAAYASGLASAAEAGVAGYWQEEPSGAVIQIVQCAEGLCLTIVALPSHHPHTDVHNPDVKLRGRALCGLRIGQGFTQTDSQHADGGDLYDPKSGRTYSGSMAVQGNTLKLRGYLGIKFLGRTETWTRIGQPYPKCTPG